MLLLGIRSLLARRLELDDPTRQLVLGRAQLAALGRGSARSAGELPRHLPPRPLSRRLVDARGDAAARGHEPLSGHAGLSVTGRVRPSHGLHVLRGQRRERQRVCSVRQRHARGDPRRRDDEHRRRSHAVGELPHGGLHAVSGAIHVVEHRERRPVRVRRSGDHGLRPCRVVGGRGVEHSDPVTPKLIRQLGHEPRLADAGLSDDQHQAAGTAVRRAPALAEPTELHVAADQGGGDGQFGRQLERLRVEVERGILAQDRLLEIAELGPRLDPDRVDEGGARRAVGVERVRLPAAAVEGQHPLCVKPLRQRLLRDQQLELPDHLAVPAVRQVAVDGQLDRPQAKLLEPPDLGVRERLLGDVQERRAAPQRECLARHSRRDQLLESPRVEPLGPEVQLVATAARDDRRAVAGAGQRLAQLRHEQLDHLRRGGRWLFAPQPLDEPVRGHGCTLVERQQREQRARLASADRNPPAADADLDGSQDAYLHQLSRFMPTVRLSATGNK